MEFELDELRHRGLNPVTARSRDNFPLPLTEPGNAYVPSNSPTLGDLTDMFDFFD